MQSVSSKAQSIRFDWMFSPWQDLLFFFLPIPFAFLAFFVALHFNATSALLYAIITQEILGLGTFHQGATWFHFIDKVNRNHYLSTTKGKFLFIVAPVALFFATAFGSLVLPALTFFIYVCWSLNHAVQQNIGLLLLYQNGKDGNEARIPREIQAWSQRWMALCFSLMYFRKALLGGTPLFDMSFYVVAACGLIGIGYVIAYFVKMASELRSGKHMNFPAFAFWLVCVSYLVPFGFLSENYDFALMIPLIVHWCQYIGINYVVVQRKYGPERIENLPMGKPVLLFAIVGLSVVGLGLAIFGLEQVFAQDQVAKNLLRGSLLGMGMVHYYLDGFIWRFRDQFPREAMLPYLVRRKP